MIGVFDSGFGGLTILKELRKVLPEYDYIYLGDNARAPYGNRSFETIHRYTLQAVKELFKQGCQLVILACNTASAKALRTIQQQDLPGLSETNRVLGIVRPTAEEIGHYSKTGHVGVFATPGTVTSKSYPIEIGHFYPGLKIVQQACPLWATLVENGELESEGTRYFVRRNVEELLAQDSEIDTILLACTHYPLLSKTIQSVLPTGIHLLSQGSIVADKLVSYLKRHPEMEKKLQKCGKVNFLTTDTADFFEKGATFFGVSNILARSLTFL